MSGKIRKMKGVAGKRSPSWPRPVTQIHPKAASAGLTDDSEGQEIPGPETDGRADADTGLSGSLGTSRPFKLRQSLTLGNLKSTDSRKACGFVPVNSLDHPE